MANPFLFAEEPANPSNGSAAFNPFLSGGMDDAPAENPFMSAYTAPQDHNAFGSMGGGSNPFAFGGADKGSNNIFGVENSDQSANFNYENIFASEPTSGMDIFGSSGVPLETKPTENIFASSTTEEQFMFSPQQEQPVSGTATPKRPPPPRPGPPKETKDLILSVTGAMEATSSDLLDRLQATRTPSPTPMRDLASPSPTHFGDLLDVDGPAAPPPTAVPQEANLLGDDFDFSAPSIQLAQGTIEPVVEMPQHVPESIMSPPQASESLADCTPSMQPSMYSAPPSVPQIPPQPSSVPSMPHGIPPAVPKAPVVNATAPSHGPPPKPPAPIAAPAPASSIPPSRPAPPSIPDRPKLPPQPSRPPAPMLPPRPTTPEVKVEPVTTESSFGDAFGGTNNTSADFSTTEVFSQPAPVSDASATQPHTDLFSTDISDDVFSAPGQEGGSPFTDSTEANVFPSESTTPFPTSTVTPAPSDEFALNFSIPPTAHPTYNIFDAPAAQPAEVEPSPFSQPSPAIEPSPFGQQVPPVETSPFGQPAPVVQPSPFGQSAPAKSQPDDFDDFAAKFESVGFGDKSADPFGDSSGNVAPATDPFDPFASSFGSAAAGGTLFNHCLLLT